MIYPRALHMLGLSGLPWPSMELHSKLLVLFSCVNFEISSFYSTRQTSDCSV